MKCFNHIDREAVGQCKNCGKGLCKDCFQQNGGICNECNHASNSASLEERYNKLRDDLTAYRGKLYGKLFGGLVLGAIITIAFFMANHLDIPTYWPFIIMFTLAPVGFLAMNFNKGGDPNKGYDDNIYTIETDYGYVTYQGKGFFMSILSLAWFLLKSMIAMMLGPICFLYLVIKIIITSSHIRKLKKAYAEVQKEEDKEYKEKQAELEAPSENYAEPAPAPTPAAAAEPAPAPTAPAPTPATPEPTAPAPAPTAPEPPSPAPAPATPTTPAPATPPATPEPTPPAPTTPPTTPATPTTPSPTAPTPPPTTPEPPSPTTPPAT
ncbi:hypothetical protein IKF30_01510 [Candidatus Saccharibacteria bacterium]|nr:hypothetical protein [Candidatus Saccharibacteria bacterium]